MLGPVRRSPPAVRIAPRPSGARGAYAQPDRQAADRERLAQRRASEQRSVEWRVREGPDGGRGRRWTVDAGSGERTVHIAAPID